MIRGQPFISRAKVLLSAAWIFAVVSPVFAENFSGRPQQQELMDTVTLGIECARGAQERCWATQYSTNPASYHISPPSFAGTNGGWYFDTNMLVIIDNKASNMVPYYANPDTVYDGTTNITMLVVTSLWADLAIGDHTNKFTSTPASGTNAATYGDYPWRIYPATLTERINVLGACQKRLLGSYAGTSFPEVVRMARISGQGSMATGGYCSVWYPWGGANLGPANGTQYNIEIDNRGQNGAGGADYISFGYNMGPWNGPANALGIILDTSTGTNTVNFSSTLELLAQNCYLLNCWQVSGVSGGEASHATYQASVSATLNRSGQEVANFAIYGIIDFPFDYCE